MGNSMDDVLKDVEEADQIRALRAAGVKEARLKAELAATKAKLAQAEEDIENLERTVAVFEETSAAKPTIKYRPITPGVRGRASAIICCNDWHAEETVEPHTVSGLNEFNLDIASSRIDRMVERAILLVENSRNLSDVDELVVWLGGDLITGMIHDDLAEMNGLSPTEAVLFIQDSAMKLLSTIAHELDPERITVVTSNGNHGRTTQKPRTSTYYRHSYEYLAYKTLEKWLKDDSRYSFRVATGYHNIVDILGRRVRFHHGDAIRYAGGSGGLSIPTNKAIDRWQSGVRCDYDIFGHWHQFCWNYSRKWISCGALIGYNAYAVQIKAEYEPPSQTYILLDEMRGIVEVRPIFVGGAEQREPSPVEEEMPHLYGT